MVLNVFPLVPLDEKLWAADPALFTLLYVENAVFYGLARHIAQLTSILL